MVKCIVFPIEANSLFEGEKGIYLDLQAYELKERKPDRKQTHIIKQSLPENIYRLLSEEDKKNLPIIGDAIVWGRQEPEPQEYVVEPPAATESYNPERPVDDLPF